MIFPIGIKCTPIISAIADMMNLSFPLIPKIAAIVKMTIYVIPISTPIDFPIFLPRSVG